MKNKKKTESEFSLTALNSKDNFNVTQACTPKTKKEKKLLSLVTFKGLQAFLMGSNKNWGQSLTLTD